MNIPNQSRDCHSERSEESASAPTEILSAAKNDNSLPILVGNVHHGIPTKNTITRIAIFRALQLGDMLQAIPAIRAIRSGFPDSEITLIGLPWAELLIQRFPAYLDRFVGFAGFPGIAEVEVDPERTARFIEEQRAYGYDLAIQMHGSGRISNQFVLALEAGMTAGYYEDQRPDKLTVGAPYPDDQPEARRNLGLVRLGHLVIHRLYHDIGLTAG